MQRLHKVALGVAAALAAHLILFFWFAPRLDGLAGGVAKGDAEPATQAVVAAEPQEAIDSDRNLEVGWPGADEQDPIPVEAAPEPPPAAKPKRRVEPEPQAKPARRQRRDPAQNDVSGSAEAVGATPIAAEASYAQRVRQHLASFAGALPPGANGEARVQFVVQTDGRVTEVQLVKRSGHAALDAMALSLPQQAQPLPLPGPQPQRLEVPLQALAASP